MFVMYVLQNQPAGFANCQRHSDLSKYYSLPSQNNFRTFRVSCKELLELLDRIIFQAEKVFMDFL